jgi:hypothetical protein
MNTYGGDEDWGLAVLYGTAVLEQEKWIVPSARRRVWNRAEETWTVCWSNDFIVRSLDEQSEPPVYRCTRNHRANKMHDAHGAGRNATRDDQLNEARFNFAVGVTVHAEGCSGAALLEATDSVLHKALLTRCRSVAWYVALLPTRSTTSRVRLVADGCTMSDQHNTRPQPEYEIMNGNKT